MLPTQSFPKPAAMFKLFNMKSGPWSVLIHAQHRHVLSLVGINSKCLGRANKRRRSIEGISPDELNNGLVISVSAV